MANTEILEELLASAREEALTSAAVGAELEAVGLVLADAETVADQVLSTAGTTLGRDLRQAQEMAEKLRTADAELEATSGDPWYLEAAYAVIALTAVALVGIVLVGLVGLLVTAIDGDSRWILSPWFDLPTAGIAVGGLVLFTGATGTLSSRNDKRVQASPTAQNVASLRSQLSAKKQTLIDVLVQDWIRPAIRDLVNSARQPSWSPVLSIHSADGLGQPLNPQLEIDTKARGALEKRLMLWAGGSIGVAGPRGVGKSTLIEALCRSDDSDAGQRRLGVMVSAPVQYEPRDFLLHLFAAVCEKTLALHGLPAPKVVDLLAEPAAARRGNQLGMTSVVVRGAKIVLEGNRRAIDGDKRQSQPVPSGVGATASELLQDIVFQQTFTSGWGGSLSTPIAFQLERGQSFTRAPMSLPEVTAKFRAFLEQLGAEHQVIIGIDELDKIGMETEAQAFLNDVKAIFAARNCFFILSISEDAMSAFERRGLPVRDAVDSALDDVVKMEYFDHGQSDELLRRRVVGLPQPYVSFCHVIGGGLPRDVLRAARRLAEAWAQNGEIALDVVVGHVLAEELARKRGAVQIEIRGITEAWAITSREVIREVDVDGGPGIAGLDRACRILKTAGIEDLDARGWNVTYEVVAYTYFLETLRDLFREDRVSDVLRPAVEEHGSVHSIELLAQARQAFALDLQTGWDLVSMFRTAWNWRVVDFPRVAAQRLAPLPAR